MNNYQVAITKRNIACWEVHLWCTCRKCKHDFDVLDTPDFHDVLQGINICDSDKQFSVECPRCNNELEFITSY